MLASRLVRRSSGEFDLHGERQAMPHNQNPDLAILNVAGVLEQLRGFALQFEVGAPGGRRRLAVNPKLQVAHNHRPRVEDRFAAANPQELDLAEADALDRIEEGALCGQ
jgi:hypothetical protein